MVPFRSPFVIALLVLGSAHVPAQEWSCLGAGLNGSVLALVEHDGEVVAGGSFTEAGGEAALNIASWDGEHWAPLGSGLNGEVHALAVYNGDLIAGGSFTLAGSTPVEHIARWDGTDWHDLGGGLDGLVTSLAVHEGRLIAGGTFLFSGSFDLLRYVGAWDGSTWAAFGTGLSGPGPSVNALLSHNGDLVVGGIFTTAGGLDAHNVARWDGSVWSSFADGIDGTVSALVEYNDQVVAGGYFTAADDVLKWEGSGWSPVSEDLTGYVSTLIVHGGSLYCGGVILTAGGMPASGLAACNLSVAVWTPAAEITALGTPVVNALCVNDGGMVVGGDMTAVDGVPVQHIARWEPWTGMPGSGAGLDLSAYPNPFSSTVAIVFTLPGTNEGTVELRDAAGRLVMAPVGGFRGAGPHRFQWEAAGMAQGMYTVRVRAGASDRLARLALVR